MQNFSHPLTRLLKNYSGFYITHVRNRNPSFISIPELPDNVTKPTKYFDLQITKRIPNSQRRNSFLYANIYPKKVVVK